MTGLQKIAVVVVVLAAIVLASPSILGLLTRGAVDDFITMSNTTGDAELEVLSYERGWFQSKMRVAVRFPEDETTSIVFDQALRHGPLLPASECGSRAGFALSTGHSSLQPVTPVIEHFLPEGRMSDDCLYIDFSGNIHTIQHVASFQGSAFDAESNLERSSTQVAWSPISVDWTYLNETRPKLYGSLDVPHFSANDNQTYVRVDGLTMRMDLRRAVLPELWDGNVVIAAQTLRTWETGTPEPVAMEQAALEMTAETGTEKATFQMSLGYSSLTASALNYGEGRWSLRFEDLGTRGIQSFNERRESLLEAGIPQEDTLYVQALREFMPDILATNPRLVLEFFQDVEDGPISADGSARVTNADVAASDDPRQWLAALDLDLSATMPRWFLLDVIEQFYRRGLSATPEGQALDEDLLERLVEAQAAATLQGLEQSGFVKKQGNAYRARLYMRDGNATVNDKRIGSIVDVLDGRGPASSQP
jgi:uncharacterized protein YdgA (DUF945 family)